MPRRPWEAIRYADAEREGRPIGLNGKAMVVSQEDADRLAVARIEFAYLIDQQMRDGSRRIMTVPVN